jgi:hypothetical protein
MVEKRSFLNTARDVLRQSAKIGTFVGGLATVPAGVAYSQNYSKIQQGVNAPTYEGETSTHNVYHFGFNKDLQGAIKSSKPQIYLIGDKEGSYLLVDPDTAGVKVMYPKNKMGPNGQGKKIGLGIKGGKHNNPCDNKGLGSKTNYLASFYWAPTDFVPKKQTQPIAKDSNPTNQTTINKNTYNNNNYDIDITYNYNQGDTAKPKPKKSSLEFRTLVEGSKRIAKNNLGGVSINPQIVAGPFGTGPYGELNFGSTRNSVSTPVYQKTLLNQNLGLFTETEGERLENSKSKYSWGAGWRATLNLNKKGNLRASASYGVINKRDSRSGVREKGFDRIIQNGKITDEKPYDFEIEKGVTSESLEQVGRAGIEYQPSMKVPLYLKAEVQNIGPIGSKESETSFNATLGLNLGGGKKSK